MTGARCRGTCALSLYEASIHGNLTIRRAQLVLPQRTVVGDVRIEDGVIAEIGPDLGAGTGRVIEAEGLTLLPGLIDSAVHCRSNPADGEDIAATSRAAALGGVTTLLDLGDDREPVITVAALNAKLDAARGRTAVNYGAYLQATDHNLAEVLSAERAVAIRVDLGDGPTGQLLTSPECQEALFARADRLLAVRADDTARLAERKALYHDLHEAIAHARIHDEECALIGLRRVLDLAQRHGRRMLVQALSSGEECSLLAANPRESISAGTSAHHLSFSAESIYDELGTRAVTTPPLRGKRHTEALRKAVDAGRIQLLASHHAPFRLAEKDLPYPQTASGMPGVQTLLPVLLDHVAKGHFSLQRLVQLTCEAPASIFHLPHKGRIEVGFDADLVLVDQRAERAVRGTLLASQAGWSPWEGRTLTGWPVTTLLRGRVVALEGELRETQRGRELNHAAHSHER